MDDDYLEYDSDATDDDGQTQMMHSQVVQICFINADLKKLIANTDDGSCSP